MIKKGALVEGRRVPGCCERRSAPRNDRATGVDGDRRPGTQRKAHSIRAAVTVGPDVPACLGVKAVNPFGRAAFIMAIGYVYPSVSHRGPAVTRSDLRTPENFDLFVGECLQQPSFPPQTVSIRTSPLGPVVADRKWSEYRNDQEKNCSSVTH